MTRAALRWSLAAVVTVAAFTAVTWLSGAFVLSMRDGGVRWGIAASLGVAVAALAALWGHSYASAHAEEPTAETAKPAATGVSAASPTYEVSGGTFYGPVFQGHDMSFINPAYPAAARPAESPPSTAGEPSPEG